jgi:hypothetical protein
MFSRYGMENYLCRPGFKKQKLDTCKRRSTQANAGSKSANWSVAAPLYFMGIDEVSKNRAFTKSSQRGWQCMFLERKGITLSGKITPRMSSADIEKG